MLQYNSIKRGVNERCGFIRYTWFMMAGNSEDSKSSKAASFNFSGEIVLPPKDEDVSRCL